MSIRFQQNRKSPTLRFSAEIQRITSETRNDRSEVIPEWGTIAKVRCALVGMTGEEVAEAATMEARASGKVIMRYFRGLTTKDRLKIGSRYFHITHILTDEGYRHYMELSVMEKLAGV